MAEVGKGPVEGGATADYEQNLDIPPLPPSNLKNCGIIDLEYNLNVVACVSGWLVAIVIFKSVSTIVFYVKTNVRVSSRRYVNRLDNYVNKYDGNNPHGGPDPSLDCESKTVWS